MPPLWRGVTYWPRARHTAPGCRVGRIRSVSKIADNPYPGSRAFTQADQAFFFGRDADTAVVVDLWTTNRLTVVSGPVASGKTSLLHAGVYPSMPVKRSRVLPAGNLFHGMMFPFP